VVANNNYPKLVFDALIHLRSCLTCFEYIILPLHYILFSADRTMIRRLPYYTGAIFIFISSGLYLALIASCC
jgi:hypothetical protein